MTELRIAGKNRRPPAYKLLPQAFAELRVERFEIGSRTEPFSVWRIGTQQSALAAAAIDLRQFAAFDMHNAPQAGALEIFQCHAYGLWIVIESAQRRSRLCSATPFIGLRTYRRPERRIMLAPPLEPESLPQQSRCDVACDQGRFDRQRARAAHRIQKSAALLGNWQPPCTHEDSGREIFLQWRGDTAHPVSTLMQAFAGEVDAHGHAAALRMHVNAQVGLIGIHRRA